jgi:2-dehydro-3-deoxy-D-gluconate 5-dehydrogenase
MFRLDNKVAIVTGASRGIGAAIAVAYAQAGARVVLVSRTTPEPDVLAALQSCGDDTFVHHPADLSRMESIPGVVETAVSRFGSVDILVNNAGIVRRTPFLEHTESDWDDVINTNLKVPVFLAQACARQMVAQQKAEPGRGGKIINICSVLSFQGGILVVGYTAAKHGLAGATKLMGNDLAPYNIQVNGIAPGYIRTENTSALQNDEVRNKAILSRIPTGRWGESQDIAAAAVFLASSGSDYMQGHILAVDGGWLAR